MLSKRQAYLYDLQRYGYVNSFLLHSKHEYFLNDKYDSCKKKLYLMKNTKIKKFQMMIQGGISVFFWQNSIQRDDD